MARWREALHLAEGHRRLGVERGEAGHRLDAAGHYHVGHAGTDVGRRVLHGHHAGGALALRRSARRVGGEAERVGDVAGGVATALEGLTQHHVVDVRRVEVDGSEDARHGLHPDVDQGQPGQGAARPADRGPGGGDDDGVVGLGHAVPPQARTKTGIVNSSEIGWKVTRNGMPMRSSSKGQSITLVIIRGPSSRSTMAAT